MNANHSNLHCCVQTRNGLLLLKHVEWLGTSREIQTQEQSQHFFHREKLRIPLRTACRKGIAVTGAFGLSENMIYELSDLLILVDHES